MGPRRSLSAALVAWSLWLAWAPSGAALAEPPGGNLALQRVLRQADTLYQEGKLAAAPELYGRASRLAAGEDRRRCFERLLAIYARVGRPDEAIRVGLEYDRWLGEAGGGRRVGAECGRWVGGGGERPRARSLALEIGEWYLALGHSGAAERHLRRALADLPGAPLPPDRKVKALTYLALATERQGERTRA